MPNPNSVIFIRYVLCVHASFPFQSPHKTYDTLLPALAELGYDGVELPLKAILFHGKDKFKKLLSATGLRVIVMAMTDGPVAPGCGTLWGGPYPGFSAPPFPGRDMYRKTRIFHRHYVIMFRIIKCGHVPFMFIVLTPACI